MKSNEDKLVILWTSRDKEVALNMVFMYTLNAIINKWWNDITFIIWGPSAELASNDQEIQKVLQKMKENGIILEACKACADKYGVSESLEKIGVDVRYMGTPLTDYIKESRKVLTF
ncbi:MAG: DsrE family protein [Candidatus Lokiarchaeota archaeon]